MICEGLRCTTALEIDCWYSSCNFHCFGIAKTSFEIIYLTGFAANFIDLSRVLFLIKLCKNIGGEVRKDMLEKSDNSECVGYLRMLIKSMEES